MNSPGAGPRQASTKAAVSRTERDWQPWIETSPLRSDKSGDSEDTPRETLSPILPLTPTGIRIDPPPSVACAIGNAPAATIAALPADDPQGVWSVCQGLRVT